MVEGEMTDQGVLDSTSPVSSCVLMRVYSETAARIGIKLISAEVVELFNAHSSSFAGTLGSEAAMDGACITQPARPTALLSSLYGDLPVGQNPRFGAYMISNELDL
jgi:hypothetical protein